MNGFPCPRIYYRARYLIQRACYGSLLSTEYGSDRFGLLKQGDSGSDTFYGAIFECPRSPIGASLPNMHTFALFIQSSVS